jgi:hypothetical protein
VQVFTGEAVSYHQLVEPRGKPHGLAFCTSTSNRKGGAGM